MYIHNIYYENTKIEKTLPQKQLWQIGKILQKLTIEQRTKKIILNDIIINNDIYNDIILRNIILRTV